MQVLKLKKYRIVVDSDEATDPLRASENITIWLKGSNRFIQDFQLVFPQLDIRSFNCAETSSYTWGIQVKGISSELLRDIKSLLLVLNRTYWVESSLDSCFMLDYHSKRNSTSGKPYHTALGQWINWAKSYSKSTGSLGDLQIADLISDQLVRFVRNHPLYRESDGIVTVLPSNPDKAFDLPAVLAKTVAAECNIPYLNRVLIKKRLTAQMKFCHTLEEKLDNILDSIEVDESFVRDRRLIILDDIFDSGLTLQETAKSLYQAGARNLYGLVVTKTLKFSR
jgi:competence protein ComFC